MDHQRSIRRQVSLEGIGLHSGKPVRLTLSPAPVDSGIAFRVADSDPIPAAPESVVDSHYATTIGRGAVGRGHCWSSFCQASVSSLISDSMPYGLASDAGTLPA